MSATLYSLERGLTGNSPAWIVVSAVTLYLAMLTHYAALIFEASIALYGLVRLAIMQPKRSLLAAWIATQAGCVAIAVFLWKTHISVIRYRALTRDVAESYLRSSLFHPGEENVFLFLGRANVRVFHFLFSQGAVSVLGLLVFVTGIVLLLRTGKLVGGPNVRALGILLLLPFIINCGAALVGVYPYGGTRHDSYLAIFAMPAIAFAITPWRPRQKWAMPVAVAIGLAICNFTVTASGSYIRPENQKKELMEQAARYLHASAPSGSLIVTDYESGLLLSYYVCGADITHSGELTKFFYVSRCGGYGSASLLPGLWVFRAGTFQEQIESLKKTVDQHEVWLFQAGFIVDREPEFQGMLGQYGCRSPRKFGANILVCRIEVRGAVN